MNKIIYFLRNAIEKKIKKTNIYYFYSTLCIIGILGIIGVIYSIPIVNKVTSLVLTLLSIIIAIIASQQGIIKNQQNKKEKQVENEKQYTIEAINNTIYFLHSIKHYPLNCLYEYDSNIMNKAEILNSYNTANKTQLFLPEEAKDLFLYACRDRDNRDKILLNFEKNLKVVIKDDNFSWEIHKWLPIKEDDEIKKQIEKIKKAIQK